MQQHAKDLYQMALTETNGYFSFGDLYLIKCKAGNSTPEVLIHDEDPSEDIGDDWLVTKTVDKGDVATLIQDDVYDSNRMAQYVARNFAHHDRGWPTTDSIDLPLPKNWQLKNGVFTSLNGSVITLEMADKVEDESFDCAYAIDEEQNVDYKNKAYYFDSKEELKSLIDQTSGRIKPGEMILYASKSSHATHVELHAKDTAPDLDGHYKFVIFSEEGVSELIRNSYFSEIEMKNYVQENFRKDRKAWPSGDSCGIPIPYNWTFKDGVFENLFDSLVLIFE